MASSLVTGMRGFGFQQCQADACVLSLVEEAAVSIVVVVHVDDIFAMGLERRFDKFCEDLNQFCLLYTSPSPRDS